MILTHTLAEEVKSPVLMEEMIEAPFRGKGEVFVLLELRKLLDKLWLHAYTFLWLCLGQHLLGS